MTGAEQENSVVDGVSQKVPFITEVQPTSVNGSSVFPNADKTRAST
jgi:hypothetical protein